MSSGRIGDQPMCALDKNDDQWIIFLKGLGLTVDLETVRKVAHQVVSGAPVYRLYATPEMIPVAAKATVYKIKRLIEDGKLDPLLQYWGLRETPEVDPILLAHLRALGKFLREDPRIRESFQVAAPSHKVKFILEQLVPPRPSIVLKVGGFPWETLPIVGKIRSHCPENQLWKDIDEWKRRQNEYQQSILHIAEKLRAELHGSLHFPGSEITNPTLERHLLLDIFTWLAGQLLGNVPNFGLIWTKRVEEREGHTFHLAWGDTNYAQGTFEQIERARIAAQDVLKQWSDSDDMRSLVGQYHSLEVLAQRLRDDIEHIDEAVLAQGSCPDCPVPSPSKTPKDD